MGSQRSNGGLGRSFVAVFIVCAAVGAAAGTLILEAAPALASCNLLLGSNIEAVANNRDGHRGEGVYGNGNFGMWISPVNSTCARVSTLDIVDTSDNQMELGWFGSPGLTHCNGDGTSRRLIVYTFGASQWCPSNPPALIVDRYYAFKEDDPNNDGNWYFYQDGPCSCTPTWSGVGRYLNTLINGGVILSNGERHDTSDSAYSEFYDLKFDQGGNWYAWSSATCYFDQDPGYDTTGLSTATHLYGLLAESSG